MPKTKIFVVTFYQRLQKKKSYQMCVFCLVCGGLTSGQCQKWADVSIRYNKICKRKEIFMIIQNQNAGIPYSTVTIQISFAGNEKDMYRRCLGNVNITCRSSLAKPHLLGYSPQIVR